MQIVDKDAFRFHPHSGIAIATTILIGDTNYEDSTGKAGIFNAGGVEWMQAAGGIWHSAAPKSGGRVYGYQLWLALPEAIENGAPESRYVQPGDVPTAGPARVILGEHAGVVSPLPQLSPLTYLQVRLADGEVWDFDPPAGHDVLWIAIDQGKVDVSGETVPGGIAIFEEGGESIELRARGDVKVLLSTSTRPSVRNTVSPCQCPSV